MDEDIKTIRRLEVGLALLQLELEHARLRLIDRLLARVDAEGITHNGKVIIPKGGAWRSR